MWFTVVTNLTISDQKSYSRHHVPCIVYTEGCVCVCVDLWVRVVLVNLASHVGLVLYVYIIPTRLPPQVGGILPLIYKHMLFMA